METHNITIYKKGAPLATIRLEIPARKIELADLIPAFQRLFDQILIAEMNDPGKISCHEGCGVCCRQLIPVTIPEVFFIDKLIKSMPLEKQTTISQRFTKLFSIIGAAGLETNLKNPMNSPDIERRYFELKADCPFLENQRCLIYESRPLVCREYHVTTPPESCAAPYDQTVQKLKIKRNLGAMLAVFSARLYMLPPVPVPLIFVPQWVKERQSLAGQKWPGTWLFDKFLNGLTHLNDPELEIIPQRVESGGAG